MERDEYTDRYEESLKVDRDWKNTIDTAIYKATKEAMATGMQKGLLEGMQKERKKRS
ncbi:MAG: hypothetical protein LUC45_02415 [Paraprevotella sp.]|nr:hypothetical protein [Paraprevotella sp.]